MLTELDLFFSDSPKLLLSKYSLPEIESMFGPLNDVTVSDTYSIHEYNDYLDRFMENLWNKYGRLEFISGQIYDYVQDIYIAKENFNINDYSIMAIDRLRGMISGTPGFEELDTKIAQKISKILQKQFIVI